ncbi:hypothetical protein GGX14DRAFT_386272 [Mycena pura]|uniref:Uncharacterized protein n=1 Tax=Mycena pura TaxID=153505 RepID=A0AAD6YPJ8_9AGAR|nr:hypothetical protein GGX14DRAFT_386272 [Mycena pura]
MLTEGTCIYRASVPCIAKHCHISPPFISIHVRRYDFEVWCGGVPVQECFAPLSVIARRVGEVQDELRERTGVTVNNVLVTSDEKDAAWWLEVTKLGWFAPDHTDTKETYGEWSDAATLLLDE